MSRDALKPSDGFICDGEDVCGTSPEPVSITAGQHTACSDFVVGELVASTAFP